MTNRINVLYINKTDGLEGAGIGGYRTYDCIKKFASEIDIKMLVLQKCHADPLIITIPNGIRAKAASILAKIDKKLIFSQRSIFFSSLNRSHHSIARFSALDISGINSLGSDIVTLHWTGDNLLSIEDIGRIAAPVVWKLADQWVFSGAEHYTYFKESRGKSHYDCRYITGYTSSNRPSSESGFDINRATWTRKIKHWKNNFHAVATSEWMADCARKSVICRDWPIYVIPNPIDAQVWRPLDKQLCRAEYGISQDSLVIAFGAINCSGDYRKGADLLDKALRLLPHYLSSHKITRIELVVFGEEGSRKIDWPYPAKIFGKVIDETILRKAYCLADIFVMPSRVESFGQTAAEAQACGVPVVAFKTSGVVDVVADGETGMLVDPFNVNLLAKGIKSLLIHSELRKRMGIDARERAIRLWNPARIAKLYSNMYKDVLASSTTKKN